MSISRGEFLRSLGKSVPGMILNGSVAMAAQKVLGKMAAASGAPSQPVAPPPVIAEKEPPQHINSGPADCQQIAFTFDDGPIPGVTERILAEFQQRHLHATFFMIGRQIAAAPDLARRVLAEGHDVGNHTFTHPKLPSLDDDQANAEIEKTQDILRDTLNHRAVWFRPPYGELRQDQFGLLEKHGLRSVLGHVSPSDWAQPGEEVISTRILSNTVSGSIIICHDFSSHTANCLGSVLDGLLERGFAPVTLTRLLG
jgi:peptidoglycan/xylan/chitin deacetylase (PgdA/CDA1 family)